ncbi:hypothetical protein JOD43_002098 [Pullulanibacillus pueri]|uniref:Type II toxin-antitoxin system PemK/MazF family toxin n=1 Tax=Pullulanibacillus pueri TaxID=1437324 RepID=A0A8J2ZWG5_9BACL|nr:type II toxin-antitoxin system PemK/MazF family toxin [Pullulanibacillus pueri]MBM7681926.1 hypothetical protein [Pullulanibacillus pueri]GGH83472.1 hypothetical protein GCM10007096_24390 [Pullulanibacillus pueri]
MLNQSYNSRKQLIDERQFVFGSVWKVDDRHISLPTADRTDSRKKHEDRWVVVVSNSSENHHPLCPVVSVAPLSHRTDLKRNFDLELFNKRDSVAVDCLLQLKLMQPILKVDLFECQNEISIDAKVELQVLLQEFFGLI